MVVETDGSVGRQEQCDYLATNKFVKSIELVQKWQKRHLLCDQALLSVQANVHWCLKTL